MRYNGHRNYKLKNLTIKLVQQNFTKKVITCQSRKTFCYCKNKVSHIERAGTGKKEHKAFLNEEKKGHKIFLYILFEVPVITILKSLLSRYIPIKLLCIAFKIHTYL